MLLFTKKEKTAIPATSWMAELPERPHFFGERFLSALVLQHIYPQPNEFVSVPRKWDA